MNDTVITGAAIGFLASAVLQLAILLVPPIVPARWSALFAFCALSAGIGAAIGWLVS